MLMFYVLSVKEYDEFFLRFYKEFENNLEIFSMIYDRFGVFGKY